MWSTTDPRCFEDNQYVPWYGCACAYWSPINVFFLWCDCVNWAHINEMSFVKKSYKRESAKTHAYKVIIWLCARQRVNYHYDFHSQSSNINRLKMQRIWAKHTKTLYRRLIWGIVELKKHTEYTISRYFEWPVWMKSKTKHSYYYPIASVFLMQYDSLSSLFPLSISPLRKKPLWSHTVLDLISHSTANTLRRITIITINRMALPFVFFCFDFGFHSSCFQYFSIVV